MFGPLVLSPQLPERTSLQQAQGAAKPVHMWPGEAAQEMAGYFDQVLDRVMRSAGIDGSAASEVAPATPGHATIADQPTEDLTVVTDPTSSAK